VLHEISLDVGEGEVVTLIGANGAGKSTTLRCVTRLLSPRSGSIRFRGQELEGLAPHRVAQLGISLVPEGRHVFPQMSVAENLEMGAWINRKGYAEQLGEVFSLFPALKARRHQLAGSLSGGEQQMLAIGRGLMAQPELLLLDEPSLGLAPLLVREIFEKLAILRERGTTILLIEQNANMALRIADRGYVLQIGRIVESGTSADLRSSELVSDAYLGRGVL
jgi:branched-chain amino acid transport system ATP-binding protein